MPRHLRPQTAIVICRLSDLLSAARARPGYSSSPHYSATRSLRARPAHAPSCGASSSVPMWRDPRLSTPTAPTDSDAASEQSHVHLQARPNVNRIFRDSTLAADACALARSFANASAGDALGLLLEVVHQDVIAEAFGVGEERSTAIDAR